MYFGECVFKTQGILSQPFAIVWVTLEGAENIFCVNINTLKKELWSYCWGYIIVYVWNIEAKVCVALTAWAQKSNDALEKAQTFLLLRNVMPCVVCLVAETHGVLWSSKWVGQNTNGLCTHSVNDY